MPWTAKDAEKHHKGLSSQQKEDWAKAANAASVSGSRDAIRKANEVVGNLSVNVEDIKLYFQSTPEYRVRHETFNGGNYLVVPVVMMVQGVHSGSHGPVLHLAEELGKIPESWNGIPVTINHPSVDGNYVSANSPEILSSWAVGTVFNARMDGDSLKAEAWIEEARIQSLSADTLERINNGEVIEVSVGVFSDEEIADGDFNGESYIAVARNHRPNHLALLPDATGACSVSDGCGIRTNQRGKQMSEKKMLVVNEENEEAVIKLLAERGLAVNETGYYELASKAQTALNAKDNGNASFYLEEIFGDNVVYKMYQYDNAGGRSVKFFKQTYQENAAGELEFTGEAVQVRREIQYPVVPQTNVTKRTRTNIPSINNLKNNDDMSEKCSPCVKAAAEKLIANKATAYQETDRDWLETLSEEQLEKMNPQPVTVQANKVTKEDAISVLSELSEEEYLQTMPQVLREQVQSAIRVNAERKTAMVDKINANAAHFSKEELNEMPMAMLEKLYLTVNKEKENEPEVNFFGFNPPALQANEETIEPLMPIGVQL